MESFIRTCAAEAVVIWAKTCERGWWVYSPRNERRTDAAKGCDEVLVTGLGMMDDRIDPSIRRRENVPQYFSMRKSTLTSILQDGVL